ncbi:MAG: ketoacyl-ACP synthase III [Clostridiales Family XIII bacterium]|jgi:3-oxoacyl-[acyl-carrier-protein] synthase-3|nr:ketoacyl-ACP synthase III [Clostridiales Family XIII bacterium]
MAANSFSKAKIAGITCAVPAGAMSIRALGGPYFDDAFISRIAATVGTDTVHIAAEDQSSGDMGIFAAKKLMDDLGWEPESIDGLIFVSQTLDYIVPPTSCRVQYELGLPSDALVMDTNYGCPGFVYGLLHAFQTIAAGTCKRMLLITAECHYKYVNKSDENTALIFGDGAAAAALEYDENAQKASFMTYVDGSYVPELALGWNKRVANDKIKDRAYSYMNGEAVTMFMLKEIPSFVKRLLAYHGCEKEDIDLFLFHQANAYMIRFLAKRLKIDPDKVPINIENFGNTSSVSIPLLICDKNKDLFGKTEKRALAVGFGSGFLIAGTILTLGGLSGGEILEQKR